MTVGEKLTNRNLVLFMLALGYMLNFLDRQLLSILAEPIKNDLGLSDTQIGLLSGFMFALFYAILGMPIAWAADRVSRVRIISASVILWSVFTALCGLAGNFVQLAIARLGVSIGEAGGSPPSYSLIADYFEPEKRATALSLYSLGLPMGVLVGSALGGWIAYTFSWREAFMVMLIPGVILGVAIPLIIKEPRRGRLDNIQPEVTANNSFVEIKELVLQKPTLWLITLGAGTASFVGYAMLNWTPPFLMRTFGMTLPELSYWYAPVIGISMAFGVWSGGIITDRLRILSLRAYTLVPAIVFLILLPIFLLGIWSDNWKMALILIAIPTGLHLVCLAPALGLVQNMTPPHLRVTMSALFMFAMNLIGLGSGPLFVGMLSDHFVITQGTESLRWALSAIAPFFLIFAGINYLASRTIKNDLEGMISRPLN